MNNRLRTNIIFFFLIIFGISSASNCQTFIENELINITKGQFVREVIKIRNSTWILTDKYLIKETDKVCFKYNIKLKSNKYYLDNNCSEDERGKIISDWTNMINCNDKLFLYRCDSDSSAVILEINNDTTVCISIVFKRNVIFSLLNLYNYNNELWLNFSFLNKDSTSTLSGYKYETIYYVKGGKAIKYYTYNSYNFNSGYFIWRDNKYIIYEDNLNKYHRLILMNISDVNSVKNYVIDSTLNGGYDCNSFKINNNTLFVVGNINHLFIINPDNVLLDKRILLYFRSNLSCFELFNNSIIYNDINNIYLYDIFNDKNEVVSNSKNSNVEFYLTKIKRTNNKYFYFLYDWDFYRENNWNMQIMKLSE